MSRRLKFRIRGLSHYDKKSYETKNFKLWRPLAASNDLRGQSTCAELHNGSHWDALRRMVQIENTTYKIHFRTIPANTILLALMTLTVLPVPVCQDIQEIYVTQTLMNVLQVNKFIVLWEKSYLNKISCFRSLSQFP